MFKKVILLFIVFFLLIPLCVNPVFAEEKVAEKPTIAEQDDTTKINLTEVDYNKIDQHVRKLMKKTNAPSVSIAIVSDNQTKLLTYGYADKESKVLADENTLYELGSMSKAFTGLAILLLAEQGKLSIDDDVKMYLPWLDLYYKGIYQGEQVDGLVTNKIKNFLYHTSGIPYESIANMRPSSDQKALENTVKSLAGSYVRVYPGMRYQYATINYDVLGLIIEVVSGVPYEDFIKKNLLEPLGLHDTFVNKSEAEHTGRLAKDYKTIFFTPRRVVLPEYRGNTPAGYYISSANDMVRWMRIQLGLEDIPELYQKIIKISHMPDTTVEPSYNDFYGAGWQIELQGKEIMHTGINPSFASMMYLEPLRNYGICVFSNLSSTTAGYVNSNITDMLKNRDLEMLTYKESFFQSYDVYFSVAAICGAFLILFFLISLFVLIIKIVKEKRKRSKMIGPVQITFFVSMLLFAVVCAYYLPNILFSRLDWDAVRVWGSDVVPIGTVLAFFGFLLFFIHLIVSLAYSNKDEKNYFSLALLSVINGFSGSLIIFIINETFNRNLEYSKELLLYFCFALFFFCYTFQLLQGRLILITNNIIYEFRMKIINIIVKTSFRTIEKIGQGKIYSVLNNDTGAISELPGIILRISSNSLIVLFCLWRLFYNSLPAFLLSLFVVAINCGLNIVISRVAKSFFERCRNIQDIYFKQMSDLLYGFKELLLSAKRKKGFVEDINNYSHLSADLSIEADTKIMHISLVSNIMYNFIFGVVVFLLPIFVISINVNDLRETLFMVFYMIAPVGMLLGTIPTITKIRININRINELVNTIEDSTIEQTVLEIEKTESIEIKFKDLYFSYDEETQQDSSEKVFSLRDVCLDVRTNEIIFITGGNGSGKSTLGKIITGIYERQGGEITINGKACNGVDLQQCFSAVYSDYHIFDRLYGMNNKNDEKEFAQLLEIMGIREKVIREEEKVELDKLSTGQKKRLAFVLCCMDEKPFMLLDEWAAEQDPEAREYFYSKILPSLKAQGKGVVIITHDDRYFNMADRLIRIEYGAARQLYANNIS